MGQHTDEVCVDFVTRFVGEIATDSFNRVPGDLDYRDVGTAAAVIDFDGSSTCSSPEEADGTAIDGVEPRSVIESHGTLFLKISRALTNL